MSETPKSTAQAIVIRAEPIELCQLLKFAGFTGSGGEAKQLISEGRVELNGAVETQKRKKVMAGDRVTCDGRTVLVTLG